VASWTWGDAQRDEQRLPHYANRPPETPSLSLTVNAAETADHDFNTKRRQVDQLVIPGVYTLANSNGAPAWACS